MSTCQDICGWFHLLCVCVGFGCMLYCFEYALNVVDARLYFNFLVFSCVFFQMLAVQKQVVSLNVFKKQRIGDGKLLLNFGSLKISKHK